MRTLRDVAVQLSSSIGDMDEFEVVSDGSAIPVLSFKAAAGVPFTVFDVSKHLRYNGWQVPAYTMPENATDVAVLRVVVREGFTRDLGEALIADLRTAVADLTAHPAATTDADSVFSHS